MPQVKFVRLGPYGDKGVNVPVDDELPATATPGFGYKPGTRVVVGPTPAADAARKHRAAHPGAYTAGPGGPIQVVSKAGSSFANFAADQRGAATGLPLLSKRKPSPYD
jgi:hypothetical protein